MECNCIENKTSKAGIQHVYGNVLRLAMPLTLRTLEKVGDEIVATDTDFIPSSDYPVTMEFSKGAIKLDFEATMRDGNIAYIEDDGTIPVGVYAVAVLCKDSEGRPYRFKQRDVLQVVDYTDEAGIEAGIEYAVTTWYLDAAIFLALRGEDGVGVEDIITETSEEIGGVNTVTIVLTDGRTKEFTVLNGSGSVDMDFDAESHHPVANSTVTAKFGEVKGELADLFGDVEYDSSEKAIKFYNKDKSKELAVLSAVPFVKDGMVNTVYISNNTLVITFNTDSGREAIGVPLTSVFNPNNYYNKTQVDNRIATAVANAQIDTSTLMTKSEYTYPVAPEGDIVGGIVKYTKLPTIILDFIDGTSDEMHPVDEGTIWGDNRGHIRTQNYYGTEIDLGSAQGKVYLNRSDKLMYYYGNGQWERISNDKEGTVTAVKMNNGTPIEPDASGVVDLGAVITQHQDISGKANTADLATVATSGSYNDLDNKPTIPSKVSDLTNDSGFATTDDVDTAIAALVSSAPSTLDTLNELAQALGDDPNFATTVATQLGNKVDKETGKGLSSNDYTSEEKSKLSGIASGAEVNVQSDWNVTSTSSDAFIKNKPSIPTKTSDLVNDSGYTTNTGTLTEADFDVSTKQDGTIEMTVGEDTYTINLNHTHPQYAETADLAEVATSGSYNDLTDKPVIPEDTDLSNYYDKDEVDSLIENATDMSDYYDKESVNELLGEKMSKESYIGIDSKLKSEKATQVVLYSMGEDYDEGIGGTIEDFKPVYEGGYIKFSNSGHLSSLGEPQQHIIYCNAKTGKLYRWNGTTWVLVNETDLSDYYNKSGVDGLLANKVDKVTGKGLSTNDYTTAEKTKLAGLSNYDDTALSGRVTALENGKESKQREVVSLTLDDFDSPIFEDSSSNAISHNNMKQLLDNDGKDVVILYDDSVYTLVNIFKDTNFTTWHFASIANSGYGLDVISLMYESGMFSFDIENDMFVPVNRKINGKALSSNVTLSASDVGAATSADVEEAKPFIINLTYSNDTFSSDKTFAQAYAAANAGKIVVVLWDGSLYNLSLYDSGSMFFVQLIEDDATIYGLEFSQNNNWSENELHFVLQSELGNFVRQTRTINGKALSSDISLGAGDVGALPDTTTIPSDLGDLTNNAGYTKNAGTITGVKMNGVSKGTSGVVDLGTVITAHQDISGKANSADLATVATSGSYNDLTNKPTIPAAQVQSDWNATSGMGVILNKPTIPSKTSDLTNDSGYINKSVFTGTCSTAAATMPKACTVDTFQTTESNGVTHAADGTMIAVMFTNSDTNTSAAPTLNVNNIGAKAIYYSNAKVTSTAKNTTVAGTANVLAYYYYDSSLDGDNGAWVYMGHAVDSNSTYSQASLGQGYAVQSNSAAAAAITASISSYALGVNGIVTIKFTYDVPANATLNISSKGAKAIYNKGAAIQAGVIKAGDTATFIYSTYYHLISVDSWQDNQGGSSVTVDSTPTSGSTNAVSSGGVYTALAGKADTSTTYTKSEIDTKIGNIETLLASI